MTRGPTLGDLRARSQKARHREVGNWMARRVWRPSAVYGTWAAVRVGASPHQVTMAALAASLAAAVAVGVGSRPAFVLGVALLHLAAWLDHVDGQVARWRGAESIEGVFLDYLMHHVAQVGLGFALGVGLAAHFGSVAWTLAGGVLGLSWMVLGLHNDCRYKAFFQRLKRLDGRHIVEGGAGGRPSPAPGWPRRGIGLATWPAAKACEAHVVANALTIVAAMMVVDSSAGAWALAVYVAAIAAVAPVVAVGRVARAIRRGAISAEFDAWFAPIGREGNALPADRAA